MKQQSSYIADYDSPLGPMILACTDQALTGVWFSGARHIQVPANAERKPDHPILVETANWLERYFQGDPPAKMPPLAFSSTPFREAVWNILQTIPYGKTRTYGEIAQQLARQRGIPRMSAQAVGGAVGHNPICILIPCHRVIGSDHRLVGYDGGLDKKEELLKLEGVLPSDYSHSCL